MKLLKELQKPFNIMTLALTIFSTGLSIYFYCSTLREKAISYSIYDSALIFDSKKSIPTLKIYEKDSVAISTNIYLTSGLIWNSGDFPIEKKDLRVPMSIVLSKNSRILDFKIINSKDKIIANFDLSKINSNRLLINWKYFDPGYGFKYQIIYTSKRNSEVILYGKVLDVESFEKILPSSTIKPSSTGKNWILGLSIFIIILLTSLIWQRKYRKMPINSDPLGVLIIAFAVLLLLVYFSYVKDYPPQL